MCFILVSFLSIPSLEDKLCERKYSPLFVPCSTPASKRVPGIQKLHVQIC